MKRTPLARNSRLKPKVYPPVKLEYEVFTSHDFWRAGRAQLVCQVTGSGAEPWQVHHVVEKHELRVRRRDRYDPRNALRILTRVHERHTSATERIPLVKLRDENIEFAFQMLGPSAYDYLYRRYSGYDRRVELALAESEAA